MVLCITVVSYVVLLWCVLYGFDVFFMLLVFLNIVHLVGSETLISENAR
jgi:hypothetical protein